MELDGHLAGTAYLVDGMRDVGVLDVGLVGGVVEDDGIVVDGVVDPLAQFLLGEHHSRGVVGVAEVDHVDAVVGNLGHELILVGAGHVGYVAPLAVGKDSCTANHDVGVDVNGIDRVGDGHGVVPPYELTDVSRVRFCTVVDEYFVGVEVHATGQEVVLYDSLPEPDVSLLGTIAVEGLLMGHIVDGLVHSVDDGGAEGLRDVADAEADDVGLGVHGLVGVDLLGNVGEEVVLLQFKEVFVN